MTSLNHHRLLTTFTNCQIDVFPFHQVVFAYIEGDVGIFTRNECNLHS